MISIHHNAVFPRPESNHRHFQPGESVLNGAKWSKI